MNASNPKTIAAVEAAINAAGGASALAATIGVKPPTVYQWRSGKRPVPPRLAVSIERMFGIEAAALRPNVFDPPSPGCEAA